MAGLKSLLIAVFFAALPALAATGTDISQWTLTDLTTIRELSAFFGDADAVITLKKRQDEPPDAVRPTVLAYKLQNKPATKLATAAEWQRFLKSYIKDPKRVILNQDTSKSGRYIVEFTSRHKDTKTDLRSIYLAIQSADKSVSLFIYDGVGPSTSRNLPMVRALYNELDQARLMEMYQADLERRKELKKAP
jgi:hypothetical protein